MLTDDRLAPQATAVLMDSERTYADNSGGSFPTKDLSDATFAAIVQLTDMRLAGKVLADLPASEADWLVLVLGREQIEEILRIDDLDLTVCAPATNGYTEHHDPFGH